MSSSTHSSPVKRNRGRGVSPAVEKVACDLDVAVDMLRNPWKDNPVKRAPWRPWSPKRRERNELERGSPKKRDPAEGMTSSSTNQLPSSALEFTLLRVVAERVDRTGRYPCKWRLTEVPEVLQYSDKPPASSEGSANSVLHLVTSERAQRALAEVRANAEGIREKLQKRDAEVSSLQEELAKSRTELEGIRKEREALKREVTRLEAREKEREIQRERENERMEEAAKKLRNASKVPMASVSSPAPPLSSVEARESLEAVRRLLESLAGAPAHTQAAAGAPALPGSRPSTFTEILGSENRPSVAGTEAGRGSLKGFAPLPAIGGKGGGGGFKRGSSGDRERPKGVQMAPDFLDVREYEVHHSNQLRSWHNPSSDEEEEEKTTRRKTKSATLNPSTLRRSMSARLSESFLDPSPLTASPRVSTDAQATPPPKPLSETKPPESDTKKPPPPTHARIAEGTEEGSKRKINRRPTGFPSPKDLPTMSGSALEIDADTGDALDRLIGADDAKTKKATAACIAPETQEPSKGKINRRATGYPKAMARAARVAPEETNTPSKEPKKIAAGEITFGAPKGKAKAKAQESKSVQKSPPKAKAQIAVGVEEPKGRVQRRATGFPKAMAVKNKDKERKDGGEKDDRSFPLKKGEGKAGEETKASILSESRKSLHELEAEALQ
eukprot:Cvel_4572.t1-p1 / transcript=Cvel_4572.t1 / gene=Cvel_4572 / organism=Chromera_velia_CCMP2878 / gene_product=hypothetical protein / transcript_product=hypothetical protein / location=Cvel_scaffold201:180-4291(-) / protein_length=669 / sequence_SO=supercontig / SO=protein_coding / is_pseudo=false